MINKLKEYVKNNATLLFKTDEKNNLEAIFDSKGFWFHSITQAIYDRIKSKPHLYVAFTEDNYIYVGISNQIGGRWKRQHAYHLGTLAYHLLCTTRYDDQNHQHWIEAWMDISKLKINNELNSIELKKTVYICFIPFELYASYNNYHQGAMLPLKTTIKLINKEVESALIQSYKLDDCKLLNVQKTTKKTITKSGANKTPPPNIPLVAIGANSFGGNNYNIGVEFNITAKQSLHTEIQKIPLFLKISYQINIFDSSNNKTIIYSGKTSAPYAYFGKQGQGGITRWEIIQREMINRGIKKATVKIS